MRVRIGLGLALLAAALAPPAAGAADPIMRLADVRAGMQCTGLSVIRATTVSSFDVEVIDVIRGEPAAYGPRILIRASGPAIASTGLGPGFSGSPIYCRDAAGLARVAGAISESVGEYGNFVALATPIEDVLGVAPLAPAGARKATAMLRSARPLQAPLTVSGLSGPVRRAALAGARRAGMPLAASPAGPAAFYPPYELVPGSSVAAGLVSGDISLSGIGTVTYRDGDRLWAFGHPFDGGGAGRRSLPMLDAYVFAVIGNPLGLAEISTYKLATGGRTVGAVTNDGIGAIAGRVGSAPPTIPLTVFARDRASGRTRTIRARVADERRLDLGSGLELATGFALGDALVSVLRAEPPRLTTRTCVSVRVRQRRRPLGYCKRYFDAFAMFEDVSSAVGLVEGYKFGPLDIEGVSIRTGVRAGVREAFIVAARAPRRVRPGQRIRIRLKLQRSRAGRTRRSFPYTVPRSTRPGRRTLTVRGVGAGSNALEEIFSLLLGGGGAASRPLRSVPELAARIAALGAPDGVRATFSAKGKGPVVYDNPRLKIRGKVRLPVVVERPGGRGRSRR